MKSFFLLPALLALALFTNAQESSESLPSYYLFPIFVPGEVLLKNGELESALLNYNADKQGFAFFREGKYYDLTGLENVDTVYISGKKFIPAEGRFYEVATTGTPEIFATYVRSTKPLAVTADKSGTGVRNAGEVSNTVSDVYVTRRYQERVHSSFEKQIWVRDFHRFVRVDSERRVVKAFPKKEEQIHAWVQAHHPDFGNEAQVQELIALCRQ